MNRQDQLTRVLALLPWLAARQGVTIEEAAAAFDVSVDQITKDLYLLIVCGTSYGHGGDLIDVDFWGDSADDDSDFDDDDASVPTLNAKNPIRVNDAKTLTRPMALQPNEAVSLVVALRMLLDLPGPHDTSTLEGLITKIELAAGEAAAPGSRVSISTSVAPDAAADVARALDEGKRVHLSYLVPSRDEITERDVDPGRIVVADGRTYLEGWCYSSDDVRLFRLDRIVAITVLDIDASAAVALTDRDLSRGAFIPSPDDELVTLLLAPQGRWFIETYPCESSIEQEDGSLLVNVRTPDTRWVARLVLRMGGSARVLQPDTLAEQVRHEAEAALAQYEPIS